MLVPINNKFSVYAAPFKNLADLTITNILNENNYQPYLTSRFQSSFGTLTLNMAEVFITDLKMTSTSGLDGYTNGMISAIWGLDTLL